MRTKPLILRLIYTSIFLMTYLISHSQNCTPTMKSEDGKLEYFGGKIRDAIALVTDDKSAYSFYIIQVDKGKDGTLAFVSFYENVDNRDTYNNAVNDYLNNEKLKSSYIEIELGDKIIRIQSSICTLQPKSSLGSIYGYNVNFEGIITKDQVILLQQHEIKKFKIVLGGKPYERTFNKSNKNTQTIISAMNCVNIENMFDIEKKSTEELDLTEITQENYSTEIIGKWIMESGSGVILEFKDDNIIIVSRMGKIISEGNYKISGSRLIFTGKTTSGGTNNGVSNFELFLKDMLILKDKGQDYTYVRME